MPGTDSWPNLVGQDGQQAVDAIKKETGLLFTVMLNYSMIELFRFYGCNNYSTRNRSY